MSNVTDHMMLDATGEEIAEALLELAGQYDTTNYKSIVAAIRRGDAEKIPNGVSFVVPHAVYGNIEFVTRRKNVDKVAGDPDRPTITIQPRYLLSANGGSSAATFQYDRKEAFYSVGTEIPAGTVCKFTTIAYGGWAAGTYKFTATEAIPVGSKLCIDKQQDTAMTSCKVEVYANAKATSVSAQYQIEAGDEDATLDLGTWGTDCNHPQRVSYGSNNEAESGIFQWLNGDTGDAFMDSIWVPKTKYDMMNTAFTSLKGFLGGFPQDFRECLALAKIHNITNDVFESQDSAYAKSTEYYHTGYFWLPSRKEIYGTNENAREDSESQFEYFAQLGTTNADKLMYAKGATSPSHYWLRTPHAGLAGTVRVCYTGLGGALNYGIASGSLGVAPLAILA